MFISRKLFKFILSGLLATYVGIVSAWTDDLDKLKDVNTLCKFEPAAQCSWAVRVGAKASGLDMRESSMASIRFDKADLSRSNLSNSILQLASLKEANLMMANLEGAHMHGVNLENANLMMANLMNVNLLDANLSGANLRGANLTGAILMKARFDNATWTDGRTCGTDSIGECR